MSAHEAEGRSNASTSKRKRELINELDSDEEETGSQLPQSQPERRHVENLIFKEWARKRAQEATRDDVKQQLKSVNEEASSIKEILAKQSISQKITNPRDYQIQLFEIAKKQNTIAVLGTGSGKTHIATLLLRWTLDIELENRAAGKTPKTAFFVVSLMSSAIWAPLTLLRSTQFNLSFSRPTFFNAILIRALKASVVK